MWLLFKALLIVVPWLVDAIKKGEIRNASQEELQLAIQSRFSKRVDAAVRARVEPASPTGVQQPDPNDRADSEPD